MFYKIIGKKKPILFPSLYSKPSPRHDDIRIIFPRLQHVPLYLHDHPQHEVNGLGARPVPEAREVPPRGQAAARHGDGLVREGGEEALYDVHFLAGREGPKPGDEAE